MSHVSDYGNEEYIQGVAANLISSVIKSGTVSRVIFTSSTAGVAGPDFNPKSPGFGQPVVMYEDRYHDEEDPGRIATRETASAYSVTKVVLPPVTGSESLEDLPAYIMQQNVTQHMGHDCFVLARDRVPDVFLDNSLIIGSPPWGARALPCCHRSSWTPALLLALVPMRSCARRAQGPCTPWSCTGALGARPLST